MEDKSITFQSDPDDAAEFGKHYHGYSKAAKSLRLKWTAMFIEVKCPAPNFYYTNLFMQIKY